MKTFFFLFLSIFLFSACSNNSVDQKKTVTEKLQNAQKNEKTNDEISPEKMTEKFDEKSDYLATMKTSMGEIKIRLFPKKAPKTVENFVRLAESGFYDGVIFHRVIPNFMIQGGDPTGTGTGGKSIFGKPFADEFSDLKNVRGALSMANAGPNTNGSQFFINVVDNLHLDGRHTVFGKVIDGMDVVDAISNVPRDADDKPLSPIKIKSIAIEKIQ